MEKLLLDQRSKSNIDRTALELMLFRTQAKLDRCRHFFKLSRKLGTLPLPGFEEVSRSDAYTMVQKAHYNTVLMAQEGDDVYDDEIGAEEIYLSSNFHYPGSVGACMTYNVIKNMGSKEQRELWLKLIKNRIYITAYAQTEIGGGTDVQNLRTIAVFDPKTHEFVFHTPSTEAMKWWPGDLGMASNHAAVFARLISNGKDHGVQAFFVKLRDHRTHVLCDGVEVGDIGPKLGYKSKDNGFLRFTHYRQPKVALLSKYIKIDDEGNVTRKGNPKRMYSAMMKMRTAILLCQPAAFFKALTIAFRYSLYRTQFLDSKGQPIRIYDYQMQRDKLFRELARGYLMNTSTTVALEQIRETERRAQEDDFSTLQNTHVLLCCLKAYFTWWTHEGLSKLILACGGHGYSMYSGLPQLLMDGFPDQILEGENSVLLLQVARHLVKCLGGIKKGDTHKVTGPFAFLTESDSLSEYTYPEDDSALEPEHIIKLFRKSTCGLLEKLGMKMFQLVQEHTDSKLVWDTMVGTDLQRVARIFSVQLILDFSWQTISKTENPTLKKPLLRLFQLGSFGIIEDFAATLLETGGLQSQHIEVLHERRNQLLEELKDDALLLAEGMQWDDDHLNSAIAFNDKDPYETLYSWAKQLAQLNQFDQQIHPAVIDYQLKMIRHQEQKL